MKRLLSLFRRKAKPSHPKGSVLVRLPQSGDDDCTCPICQARALMQIGVMNARPEILIAALGLRVAAAGIEPDENGCRIIEGEAGYQAVQTVYERVRGNRPKSVPLNTDDVIRAAVRWAAEELGVEVTAS